MVAAPARINYLSIEVSRGGRAACIFLLSITKIFNAALVGARFRPTLE